MIKNTIEIQPLETPFHAVMDLPGSKSITNRALLLAAVSEGETLLQNFGLCDDTEAMLEGLKSLGVNFCLNREKKEIRIQGCSGIFPHSKADIFTRDSGTMTRFLIPMLAIQKEGAYRVSASERMTKRPLRELLKALETLGANIEYLDQPYSMPLIIHARGLRGGEVRVSTLESTQFLSGLLMAGGFAKGLLNIRVIGKEGKEISVIEVGPESGISIMKPLPNPHSESGFESILEESHNQSYVKMTIKMVEKFQRKKRVKDQAGIEVEVDSVVDKINSVKENIALGEMGVIKGEFSVFAIEPDLSTASYFFAAAVLTGGEVEILNIPPHPLQGDIQFLDVLSQMGALVVRNSKSVVVRGGEALKGIPLINMRNFSDTFMTLAAIASFADSPTEIRGVAHTRLQESDRIEAISTGLIKLGAHVEVFEDGLKIFPAKLHGGVVDSYNDHRIAMSLALVGLKVPGVIISQFECVNKTCPRYFNFLR